MWAHRGIVSNTIDSPSATRNAISSSSTPVASASISGTPPPMRPLSSITPAPHGGGCHLGDRRALILLQRTGNEEPGLPEGLGGRKASGDRKMADLSVADHALDRYVVREVMVGGLGPIPQVLLEH